MIPVGSVGLETTAPAVASVIARASERGLDNFSVLAACKSIVPALEALASPRSDSPSVG